MGRSIYVSEASRELLIHGGCDKTLVNLTRIYSIVYIAASHLIPDSICLNAYSTLTCPAFIS